MAGTHAHGLCQTALLNSSALSARSHVALLTVQGTKLPARVVSSAPFRNSKLIDRARSSFGPHSCLSPRWTGRQCSHRSYPAVVGLSYRFATVPDLTLSSYGHSNAGVSNLLARVTFLLFHELDGQLTDRAQVDFASGQPWQLIHMYKRAPTRNPQIGQSQLLEPL